MNKTERKFYQVIFKDGSKNIIGIFEFFNDVGDIQYVFANLTERRIGSKRFNKYEDAVNYLHQYEQIESVEELLGVSPVLDRRHIKQQPTCPVYLEGEDYTDEDDKKLNDLECKFKKLKDNWIYETCTYSSTSKIITNQNYLKIIALGENVVPLILKSLDEQPTHWFAALEALTGEDPTEYNYDFKQCVTAWLDWGKQKGLI